MNLYIVKDEEPDSGENDRWVTARDPHHAATLWAEHMKDCCGNTEVETYRCMVETVPAPKVHYGVSLDAQHIFDFEIEL